MTEVAAEVRERMTAEHRKFYGWDSGASVDWAVAVAVEMIEKERARLGPRPMTSELIVDLTKRAEAAEKAVKEEAAKAITAMALLAEHREKWKHVAGCGCGVSSCDEAAGFGACADAGKRKWPHTHRDPRCAPEVKNG